EKSDETLAQLTNRVLKPYGGDMKLMTLVAYTLKVKQTSPAGTLLNTVTNTAQLPDKFRWEIEYPTGWKFTRGINGNQRWINPWLTGAELPIAYWRDYFTYLGPRAVLRLKDKGAHEVELAGKVQEGGKSATVVRLKSKSGQWAERKLYFD